MPSYYAIRQRSTGFFLPRQKSGQKGGTWVEPKADVVPRLWRRASDARGFLTVWLQGGQRARACYSNLKNDIEYVVDPQPTRNRDDMEVIEICIVPK